MKTRLTTMDDAVRSAETESQDDRLEVPFAGDFSYGYYADLLSACSSRFELRPLRDFRPDAKDEAPACYVRHDIDLCLDAAVALAEQEAAQGVSSTYMFIPTSPLYDIASSEGAAKLRRVQALGHEVAIHFDVATSGVDDPNDRHTLLSKIDEQCAMISDLIGESVPSVSFHRPLPIFLHGPDYLGGRVNAYSRTLMQFYRSDSGGRWRSGNPIPEFQACCVPVAQLLTHPIWWAANHLSPALRLDAWFESKSRELNPLDRRRFDDLVASTVPGVTRASRIQQPEVS